MSYSKKILAVVESIDIEDSSGSKANVALIKNLHKVGYEVIVYHYTRKEIYLENISCVAIKENRRSLWFFLSRTERLLRYKLNLDVHSPLEKVFGFSFTLFNDRNSIVDSLKKINDFNPDLVLTLSKGGSYRPHHALLKLPSWHKKWMAYIHDPYPMYLYPPPFAWPEPGSMKKWQFVMDVSQKAAFSAFPSKLLWEWMGGYFPGFLEKGVVIPHQIDLDDGEPKSLPEYFNPEIFNLLHAGTLLAPRNPEFLIEAYKNFLDKNPAALRDTRLIFIGNTELHDHKIRNYQKIVPECLIVQTSLDYKTVLEMQSKASVNVILEAKSKVSPFLPGKFPHCVKANKPILLLGPEVSETRRLLGGDYEYYTEIDEVEKIEGIIKVLYNRWKDNPENLKLNRSDLIEYLSKHNLKSILQPLVLNG